MIQRLHLTQARFGLLLPVLVGVLSAVELSAGELRVHVMSPAGELSAKCSARHYFLSDQPEVETFDCASAKELRATIFVLEVDSVGFETHYQLIRIPEAGLLNVIVRLELGNVAGDPIEARVKGKLHKNLKQRPKRRYWVRVVPTGGPLYGVADSQIDEFGQFDLGPFRRGAYSLIAYSVSPDTAAVSIEAVSTVCVDSSDDVEVTMRRQIVKSSACAP